MRLMPAAGFSGLCDDEVKIVPNLLSLFRICLVPVFIAVYFTEQGEVKIYAIAIYVIASLSDFLDGYIARKFHASTNLGRVLDPLGDKLMMISVMTCITIDGIIPIWAVLTAGVKELLMAIGGYVMHRAAKAPVPQSNMIGKASTVFFFLICVALMLLRDIPGYIAICLISAGITVMLLALASYVNTYIKFMKSR